MTHLLALEKTLYLVIYNNMHSTPYYVMDNLCSINEFYKLYF